VLRIPKWSTLVKVLGWLIASLLFIVILAILLIRLPSVQNKLTQKAISFLEKKIGTQVQLEHIFISFPKKIVLKGLYLKDQSADTLLYVAKLSIDTDLWALTKNAIQLNSIGIDQLTLRIKNTTSDSTFNFDYIIKAFTEPTAVPSQSPEWIVSIENVEVSNSKLSYQDEFNGNDLQARLGHLKARMDTFDIKSSSYKAKAIECANSSITYMETPRLKASMKGSVHDPTQETSYDFDFDVLSIKNTRINYISTITDQHFDGAIGELFIASNRIDLLNHLVDIKKIKLDDSFFSFSTHGKLVQGDIKSDSDTASFMFPLEWKVSLNRLELGNNGIQYYDFSTPEQRQVFDPSHIWIQGLNLISEKILISESRINAKINLLNFNDKNGFSVSSFSSELLLTNEKLGLKNFHLKTRKSTLNINTSIHFTSIAEFQKQFNQARFDFDLSNSLFALEDAMYFSPSLLDSVPLALSGKEKIAIDAELHGYMDNLRIVRLNIHTLTNTVLRLHGSITGLPTMNSIKLNGVLDQFYTSNKDIKRLLPDSLTPASIRLPDWLELKGKINGLITQPNVSALLTSSAGRIELTYKSIRVVEPKYEAKIKATQLDIGDILKLDDVGKTDLNVAIRGSGFTWDSLDAEMDIIVKSLVYKKYDYRDFKLSGSLKNSIITATGILKDTNLDFELAANLDYHNKVPRYLIKFNLLQADFTKLNLSNKPLKTRANFHADLAISEKGNVNGRFGIRNASIYNGKALYKVDSLMISSLDLEGESELSVQSDILTGKFNGTFNILGIGDVLRQHVNHYFSLHDRTVSDFSKPQNFKFSLVFKNTDLLTKIIFPKLTSLVPIKLEGAFDSKINSLSVDMGFAKIKYANTSVDSFAVKIKSDEHAIHYTVNIKKIMSDTWGVPAMSLMGKIAHDSVQTRWVTLDSLGTEKYVLGGVIQSNSSGMRYSLASDQIMLNYGRWKIAEMNYLQIGSDGITANNFSLSNGNEKISVISNPADSTISLEFLHWQLRNVTKLVEGIIPASGELNGNIKFTTGKKGEFHSSLAINQLSVFEKNWGIASIDLSHKANRYNLDFGLKGENMDIKAFGYFAPTEGATTFNIEALFSPLNLALIEPFTFNQLKNVKGLLSGSLTLSGDMDKPIVRGLLTFENASFVSTYLNNSFSLKNESIAIQESGVVFSDFKLADHKSNTAVLKGMIHTKTYKDFDFDLKVSSRNFQLLNTTVNDNPLYFGSLNINANARITGNTSHPKIDLDLHLNDGSQITYIVKSEEKNVMQQKGIVKFISNRDLTDPFLRKINLTDTAQSVFKGLDMNATIELTDKVGLDIVIDPSTGDKLSLKGNSTLVFNSLASGTMKLSGRYEITSGTYGFSFYKLVKREFDIVKGSSINWSGNPLNASMDLRALYKVETSPLDLVYNQIRTSNASELNAYKQKLPFFVYLNIKGMLLVPEISFALDMPDNKRNVFGGAIYGKLQDINTRESDLNKQVFALLILSRFISDNPFESQVGSSLTNTARESVSQLLSEQLNRLSQKVKGIQLTFDVRSFEANTSTEVKGQTKAQLGVSRSLLNDRLIVKLSGNVDIEGGNSNQNKVADYIGDLALEYKITPDGRFRITGFRTANHDMIDGELTETGVGLIYIKDYTTLRELFKSDAVSK
jgi:translocation and assembly module TamB